MSTVTYNRIVDSIKQGLIAKRVHSAANIVAIKANIQEIDSFAKHCKFEIMFILHQLWTPTRMKYLSLSIKDRKSG